MIAQSTIDAVFAATEIVDIIGQFVTLKKSGSAYLALSPFTAEKTPSFYVVPSKQIFKCFSSGKGGGVVTFLMEAQGMDFRQAIRYLADYYSIPIEENEEDPKYTEQREKNQYFTQLNKAAQVKYSEMLHKISHSEDPDSSQPYWPQIERFSNDQISQWQIGIATDDAKYIYSLASEKGKVQDCHEAGLLGQSQGQYYDYFRERIIFPIHDKHERIVGFGGRTYTADPAKYLNTRETSIFKKDNYLYGLCFAQKAILNGIDRTTAGEDGKTKMERVLQRTAILQEGYTDVIAFHHVGMENAVASLGTALSETHCQELKRLAHTIILMRDGDVAGMRAAQKDTLMLLKKGFKVRIALLPDEQDPEDLAKELGNKTVDWVMDNHQDALTYFAMKMYNAATDAYDRAAAIDQIAGMIGSLPDSFVQEDYRKAIAKDLKLKIASLKSREEEIREKEAAKKSSRNLDIIYGFEGDRNLPDDANLEEIQRRGYFGKVDRHLTGYYMLNNGTFEHVSNFIMSPILHKYDPEDNSRILKLENGLDEPTIIEVPSDSIVSSDKFRSALVARGPYHWFGTKRHLDSLLKAMLRDFPTGHELKTLGWQNEGFFAYFNCCYLPGEDEKGGIAEYNEAGLVQVRNKWYFSPASSSIFRDERKDNDQFEKDRQLQYNPPLMSFNEWTKLMMTAYGQCCYSGIPFVLVSLFKDIVYAIDNNCPHLYLYGESKSGKSKYGESVANAFFCDLKPFSMANGTDAAFAAALDRFRNTPMLFNEFDESAIKEERFQAVKTAFDGEGRERLGRGGSKMRSNTQKVNVTMILMGQYLATKDDNSVVGRSILENFKLTTNRPEAQTQAYNELKYLEKKGLGGMITELLPYRPQVEKEYYDQFHHVFKTVGKRIRDRKKNADERVLRNYSALATMVRIFQQWFTFPWTEDEYLDWMEDRVIYITNLMSESDILKDFWLTVQTLYDSGKISERKHFKVKEDRRIRVDDPETTEGYLDLGEAKKLLYIRLAEIHKMYLKESRTEGTTPINKTSLIAYLKTRPYYQGYVKSEDIGGHQYSCFIFEYEKLGMSIEGVSFSPGASADNGAAPYSTSTNVEDLPF